MAKSKSFFGLRKGSTKTMTYSVLRGIQVTKDRVFEVANPRTQNQMATRIPFAQAVKFYKFAVRALFKFAFEDKRPTESDYNAMIRHNVARAASVDKGNYNNPNYPAIGNWMLSQGQLKPAIYDNTGVALELTISEATKRISTIGKVSSLILSEYPNIVAGDIVTFVIVTTPLTSTYLDTTVSNEMKIVQFVLDETDTRSISDIGLEDVEEGSNVLKYNLENDSDFATAGAVIFSRNTPKGLLVSNAVVSGNGIWNTIIAGKLVPSTAKADKYSWGADEQAILQGSLVE